MGIYNITISNNPQKDDSLIDESSIDNNKVESTKPVEIPANEANKKSSEEKTIVLDGPLSQIYTQALNIVYAKESINMISQMNSDDNGFYDNKNNNDKDLYVYCCNGDTLDSDGLVEASNKLRLALDNKNNKKVILSVECVSSNNKIALLDEFSSNLGIKVIYSRNRTLDNIKSIVEG